MTPVRVLAMLSLALWLVGCNGDRMKDSNLQPPLAMLTASVRSRSNWSLPQIHVSSYGRLAISFATVHPSLVTF
jgi:hypothetical protein